MKKITGKLILLIFAIVLTMTVFPSEAQAAVKISKTKATLNVGSSMTLKITGTKKKVKWSSSDKKVASVSSKGKVTAKKAGKATIVAKIGKTKKKCKVTVKNVAVKSVSLNYTSKKLYEGDRFTLKATVSPKNATNKKVQWSSSNPYVASVSSGGKVSATNAGTAKITAKCGGKSKTCKITVVKKSSSNKPVATEEGFNATEATKNVTYELKDTGKGVVGIFKNNNNVAISLRATVMYYMNGKMVGMDYGSNSQFESKSECALYIDGPRDTDYKLLPYDDYKMTMNLEECSTKYYILGQKGIKYDSDMGTNSILVQVSNESGKYLKYIQLVCVCYDANDRVILYDYEYPECNASGGTVFVKFDFPEDENENIITPDHYKLYVNSAYTYL